MFEASPAAAECTAEINRWLVKGRLRPRMGPGNALWKRRLPIASRKKTRYRTSALAGKIVLTP